MNINKYKAAKIIDICFKKNNELVDKDSKKIYVEKFLYLLELFTFSQILEIVL